MGKNEPLIVNELKALIDGYSKFQALLKIKRLNEAERNLYQTKILLIEGIFIALKHLEEKSDKQKLLLRLCLENRKCSQRDADGNFKSVDSLRAAKNQFRFFLASTLFRSDKVALLLQSNSLEEMETVIDWYKKNVFDNPELIRLSVKPS
ncbi:MAG: hypothetical protein E6230_06675 [Paenibacillus dendritiformis]|jgi:hypothetical protein|uniref:hypothetical protein n=1 Tax=uncultured Paenibacillus sp. TaxID=227322 RepID=UPI0025E21EEB|nr:hypothetical protein [uncultured Paenibacillus sp.]MDU5141846.1 hypothetical protein [Paenibacillus dendritiformis]